jgi:hypothetical protein
MLGAFSTTISGAGARRHGFCFIFCLAFALLFFLLSFGFRIAFIWLLLSFLPCVYLAFAFV